MTVPLASRGPAQPPGSQLIRTVQITFAGVKVARGAADRCPGSGTPYSRPRP
jgi:hypothetical protein